MRPRRYPVLLVTSLLSLSSFAQPNADKPVLSEAGRKKASENLAILSTSLRNVQEGLATIQKNVKVINDEIRELDELERQHNELKKKYEAYLSMARREMSRNDEELKRITDAEKQPNAENASGSAERRQR